MSHLFKFAVSLECGERQFTITTTASTEQAAKNNVVQSEGCPETAITKVETIKQFY